MKRILLSALLVSFLIPSGLIAKPAAARSRVAVKLTQAELNLGRAAFQYFLNNRHPNGMVNATEGFPMMTMWDAGSLLAGLVAANQVGLLAKADFDTWMSQALSTLHQLPLYKKELPNKAYHAASLLPIDYGMPETRKEVGFSGIDIGRLVRWLKLVEKMYPQHAAAVQAVIGGWKKDRLTKYGQMHGVHLKGRKEKWDQEGRFGYEQYGALGLEKLGLNVADSLANTHRTYVDVSGVEVPADNRTTYHNYVTSEPFILDGLESGFRALTEADAQRILAAQEARYRQMKILTAWTEDNLNKHPWFTYNCLYVNGYSWRTLAFGGEDVTGLRGSSTKAALAWHALFRTPYTLLLHKRFQSLFSPQRGVFAGILEVGNVKNEVVSLNTNAIVLEALFYLFRGESFEEYANRK